MRHPLTFGLFIDVPVTIPADISESCTGENDAVDHIKSALMDVDSCGEWE
jgi:hypothetical protein